MCCYNVLTSAGVTGFSCPSFCTNARNVHGRERIYAKCLVQDLTYAKIFQVLNKAINPTITGLALRLAFHDAASYDPNGKQSKGG